MKEKLDVLIFASHPDDAELGCAGTILKMVDRGKKVGIIDLTRGELGSRGSAEIRDQEAAKAGTLLGLSYRGNLGFRDGFFVQDEAHQLAVIRAIRNHQPEIVIANAPEDRHPDHGRGSKLVRDAAFYSGLIRITTDADGKQQEAWRPKRVCFFIQDYSLSPDFVVDITPYYERKKEVLAAYASQFFLSVDPENSSETKTYISSPDFWHFLEGRARNMGHMIGATFGEGYMSEIPLELGTPLELIGDRNFLS